MPLVPGVMLLEWALRETARALAVEPCQLRILESKFFSPLRPEARADLHVEFGSKRQVFRILRGAELLASGILEIA